MSTSHHCAAAELEPTTSNHDSVSANLLEPGTLMQGLGPHLAGSVLQALAEGGALLPLRCHRGLQPDVVCAGALLLDSPVTTSAGVPLFIMEVTTSGIFVAFVS